MILTLASLIVHLLYHLTCSQLINLVIPIRTSTVNELLGSDYSEHNILHAGIGIEKAVDVLKVFHDIQTNLDPTGNNLGEDILCLFKFTSDSVTRSFDPKFAKVFAKYAHSIKSHPKFGQSVNNAQTFLPNLKKLTQMAKFRHIWSPHDQDPGLILQP